MVLCHNLLQVIGEGACLVGVAVGYVGNEVDDVVEGLDRLACCCSGGDEKDLFLGNILLPLFQELFFVGSGFIVISPARIARPDGQSRGYSRWVAANLVLQTRTVAKLEWISWGGQLSPYKSASIFSSAATFRLTIVVTMRGRRD
jgi:hypothetical protein